MKLRKIYESILTEIGDSAQVPPGATFSLGKNAGKIEFSLSGEQYLVLIKFLFIDAGKGAIQIDFITASSGFSANLTNKGEPLKVMGYVVGSIEEWLIRYNKKYLKSSLIIVYLKYNPKSEEDEEKGAGNKRDRLYRMFIEKFAKKYNSSVNFSTTGGIIAQFKPPLEIK